MNERLAEEDFYIGSAILIDSSVYAYFWTENKVCRKGGGKGN